MCNYIFVSVNLFSEWINVDNQLCTNKHHQTKVSLNQVNAWNIILSKSLYHYSGELVHWQRNLLYSRNAAIYYTRILGRSAPLILLAITITITILFTQDYISVIQTFTMRVTNN